MERIKHKRIIGLLIIIFAFIVFTPKNVFASAACDEAKSELEKVGFDRYGISFSYSYKKNTYTIEMSETAESSAFAQAYNVTNATFQITEVKVTGKGGNSSTKTGEEVFGKGKDILKAGTKITFTRDKISNQFGIVPYVIEIILKPANGFMDPKLKTACQSNNSSNQPGFTLEASVTIDSNKSVGGKWEYWSDGDLKPITSEYTMSIDCDEAHSTGSFEYEFCNDKKKAEAAGAKKFTFGQKGNSHQMYSDLKEGAQPQQLKCNYKIDRTNPSIWSYDADGNQIPNPNYYANTSYFIGETSYTLTAGSYNYNADILPEGGSKSEPATCQVKCEEIVTAEYGQPVATHGGICFEYKVRVTSRVSCGVMEEKLKQPKKGLVCTPTPECVHDSYNIYTQGGPSEEFDKCIKKCDGGKYTDKCSNKCYKKVYGTSSSISKTSNTDLSLNYATKVAYLYPHDAKLSDCMYTGNGGNILWKVDSRVGDTRMAADEWGADVINCDSTWHRVNNETWGIADHVYSIYKNGIPATKSCTDDCHWLKNDDEECTNGKNYVYYNDQKYYGEYHNGAEAQITKDMKANEETYKELKNKCMAAVKCNTSTAEFTISATYDTTTNTTKKPITIDYPYENKKDSIKWSEDTKATSCSKTEALKSDKLTTILDDDGCYNCAKGCDASSSNPTSYCSKWYRTEWSFPGTWVSGKHSDMKYYREDCIDGSYTELKYKFCLPGTSKDVNVKWYNYYQTIAGDELLVRRDPASTEEKTCKNGEKLSCNYKTYYYNQEKFTASDVDDLDYNIKATARKFGYFEWDIDINCFYAQNTKYMREECTCDGDKIDKCPNPPCDGEVGVNYDIDNKDVINLFPDKEGNALTSPEARGRTPGFNWSAAAIQENKDPAYQSNPVEYATWVQKKGYAVYSDEYLDYEIYLSKEKINEIRKQDVKYGVFEGEFDTPGKTENKSASTYKSTLIRKTLKDDAIYPGYEALKCNNIGSHIKIANYDAECATFKNGEEK